VAFVIFAAALVAKSDPLVRPQRLTGANSKCQNVGFSLRKKLQFAESRIWARLCALPASKYGRIAHRPSRFLATFTPSLQTSSPVPDQSKIHHHVAE
jgi:hypothetical protein